MRISNMLEPIFSLVTSANTWIRRGRELVKKVRRDCVVCRRNRAQPCKQMMADLTESRLDFGPLPFTRAAADLFGPLEIGLYRNRTVNRWGVLYTCLVTRAIFLDLVPSLSSMDFLLSLRRFITKFFILTTGPISSTQKESCAKPPKSYMRQKRFQASCTLPASNGLFSLRGRHILGVRTSFW